MVDSPTKIYKDYVRANLPNGMSYDTGTNRYDINNHSFFSYNNSNWYYQYISKYGYSSLSAYAVNNFDPALVFDFKNAYFRKSATDSTFAASITHTRASSATMVNSSGNLVTVGTNVPRTGHHIYNGSAWVNEGILHESEARTNQMLHSGDITGTGWSGQATAGTVTAGSPFGNYQTISPASSAANLGPAQRYQIGKSITSGSTYVGWALVKYSAGSGWFVVNMYDTGKQSEQAYFDLQNGVVGSKEALIIDHGMIDYGDGWWLCWASSNAASGSGGMSNEMPNGDGVQSCSAADVILIAGSQFELGTTPSSYIPTAGAQVTRAADLLTVPAANLPYPTTPVVIGPELVTNGTFATDISGWASYNSVISWDAGLLKVNDSANAGSGSQAYQVVTLEVGKRYRLTGSYENSTASRLWIDNSSSYVNPNSPTAAFIQVFLPATTPSVDFAHTFVATATTTSIALEVDLLGTAYFDNISVKEVNPLALSIQMDGKMTYAEDGGNNTALPWRWRLNSSNILYNTIATAGTRTGQPRFVQSQTTSGFDEVLGANNVYSPDTNVPFNIASRHGSTFINGAHEGTLLTANTTPTILPDLSATDLELGYIFMGTIGEFRIWSDDLGDVGITEATLPSTEPSLSLTFDGSENSFIVLDWSE